MKKIFLPLLLLSVLFIAACTTQQEVQMQEQHMEESMEVMEEKIDAMQEKNEEEMQETTEKPTSSDNNLPLWMTAQLTDVNTQETFIIEEIAQEKPVLLESFAVWCPKCTSQQKETKALHEEIGDTVHSIALNTDPNEDAAKVIEHTQRFGFDWTYAISPKEVTQNLIDEFGVGIVNAPAVPMVLICSPTQSRMLSRGVKSVDKLKAEIKAGC